MTPEQWEWFRARLRRVAQALGRRADDDAIAVYFEALDDLTLDQVDRALVAYLKRAPDQARLPTPALLRSLAGDKPLRTRTAPQPSTDSYPGADAPVTRTRMIEILRAAATRANPVLAAGMREIADHIERGEPPRPTGEPMSDALARAAAAILDAVIEPDLPFGTLAPPAAAPQPEPSADGPVFTEF